MDFVLISAVGAVISQVGDLAASAIKRNHEIKDYGKLIPGHGGVMDRFDSVIFTAPMIYFSAFADTWVTGVTYWLNVPDGIPSGSTVSGTAMNGGRDEKDWNFGLYRLYRHADAGNCAQ